MENKVIKMPLPYVVGVYLADWQVPHFEYYKQALMYFFKENIFSIKLEDDKFMVIRTKTSTDMEFFNVQSNGFMNGLSYAMLQKDTPQVG